MATATEISTRALRRIRVVTPDETPSGQDVESAKEALTAMINSWEADGLTSDVLPLDARFEQAIVAMLAVRISEEFGKQAGPVLVRDAERGWKQIEGAFFAVPEQRFESALIDTGAPWYAVNLDGTDDIYRDNYRTWEASTEFALREYCVNNKMLYECITAGTSASSGGPTGTDASITDGTVVWCFRRVDG